MDIFDGLTLIGGLSIFLFGMNLMGQALERRAGDKLRALLEKLTTGRMTGLLTGLCITAVIQSSSATTVMVVGFVNSGLMTLRQAINVIMGANIGTTVTAWLLSLAGIDSANFFVKLLKPTSFTPILALIGIIFYMFTKNAKKQDTGMILLGFATLMFGMDTMSGAVSGLRAIPEFQNLFVMFEHPILGVLAGAILTAVIQSSSASVGILQALAVTGQVTYGAAIPIIMGQNIGTCITAMLSAVGASKNAKRAACVHLSFNVIGTVVWLTVFSVVRAIFHPTFLGQSASLLGIAVAHSIFNLLCTVLLVPFTGLLEQLVIHLIPDTKQEEILPELDERLLMTPPIALKRCKEVTGDMAKSAIASLQLSLDALAAYTPELSAVVREKEEVTDHYEDILGTYLVKLSNRQVSASDRAEAAKLLKLIGDFERIADHAVNIIESAEEMQQKDLVFTEYAQVELHTISGAVKEISDLALTAFLKEDFNAAYSVEPLEQIIDELKEVLRTNHIMRLQVGSCSIVAGFVWSDLLTDLERCSDHCSNIAFTMMERKQQNFNLHESVRKFRRENPAFQEKVQEYREKYALRVQQ